MDKLNEIGVVCGFKDVDGSEYLEDGLMEACLVDSTWDGEGIVCSVYVKNGIVFLDDSYAAEIVFGGNVPRITKELVEWVQKSFQKTCPWKCHKLIRLSTCSK